MRNDHQPGIYTLTRPAAPAPLVFDSPHSGRDYPADFTYACDRESLEKAEDRYVEALFDTVTDHGGHLLCAHFPRSYIDVNRAADDIDLELLDGPWPDPIRPSSRSDAGIGLIRRLVRPGLPVYDRKLSSDSIRRRIDTYYTPYHSALGGLIDELHYGFGQVWHLNCHSMPSRSTFSGPLSLRGPLADFVLGDRDGTTCAPTFTHAIRDFLKHKGYSVALNDPYRGVELVRRYSNPARGRHSLQIEINKSLYMNEKTGEKTKNYNIFKKDIDLLAEYISSFTESQLVHLAAD